MKNFDFAAPIVQTFNEYLPQPYEDAAGNGVIYYGWAPLGVGEDEEGWRIMRQTNIGTEIKREYADGSMEFKFKWSERSNYIYTR